MTRRGGFHILEALCGKKLGTVVLEFHTFHVIENLVIGAVTIEHVEDPACQEDKDCYADY